MQMKAAGAFPGSGPVPVGSEPQRRSGCAVAITIAEKTPANDRLSHRSQQHIVQFIFAAKL